MLNLRANVYARPKVALEGPEVTLRGLSLPTLRGATGGPPAFLATLPVTFEAIQAALLELPQSDCEPDGFFLVTGREDGVFWRLNGHMHEYDGAMHRVELNGECPTATLDKVLQTMGWPDVDLVFELVQEGVTLEEKHFRKWAAATREAQAKGESRVVPTAAIPRAAAAVGDDAALAYTVWHITFGTYGTRLHGDARPTVDRDHNQFGEPFLKRDDKRYQFEESSLKGDPVVFSSEQRAFIERAIPDICVRGGWRLHAAAAQPDHVHVVCGVRSDIHGEKVRRLLKRWLTERLDAEWPDPNRPRWWAVEGSNKAIHDECYLRNAIAYVTRQKTCR